MLEVYHHSKSNRFRYTLGNKGKETLIVFGVNPSQATNLRMDHTVSNVKKFSEILGFDSFVMLNLYAQRATDPNDLSSRFNKKEHINNLNHIKKFLSKDVTVWAAWGDLIGKRPYLPSCLSDVHATLKPFNPSWIQYDIPTKKGHPKHPARKKQIDRFQEFDIEVYLEGL